MKCIFYCLTVVKNSMQKFAHIAEIATKVVGEGVLFSFTWYCYLLFTACQKYKKVSKFCLCMINV